MEGQEWPEYYQKFNQNKELELGKKDNSDNNSNMSRLQSLSNLTISTNSCIYPAPTLTCDQWAENLPPSKHVRRFINKNWAQTPLGPLSSWSISLRLHIFTLFADSKASLLYWFV